MKITYFRNLDLLQTPQARFPIDLVGALCRATGRRAEALVRERGLWWLSAEDGPRTQALSGLTPPADPVPGEERADPAQHTFWVLSGPDARSADGIGRRLLARTHPHGRWLAWMGD